MKVIVDRKLCESNARCVRECPEIFALDQEHVLVVEEKSLSGALLDKVRQAIDACPRQALSLETDASS